jgi:hypothetical protein
MANWKDKLALTAQQNRQEIIRSKLSRREMMRLGLLTAGGSLILKKGLSARAFADDGTLTFVKGVDGPPSPPIQRPFIQELPRLPVLAPSDPNHLIRGGVPQPFTVINGASQRYQHQFFAQFPPPK